MLLFLDMDLRAIIIDDEIDGVKSLQLLCEKFVPELTIIASTTNPLEGITFIDNYRPDIVFLDINMPGINGLELLDKIKFKEFRLIFTTAHEEFGLKALKLGTTDYLLKPIDSDDLIEAVERARAKTKKEKEISIQSQLGHIINVTEKKHKILVSDKEVTEYCDADEIIRMEARSNYTWVVFTNKKGMLVSKTMKEMEKQLEYTGTPFLRVHQSHIVNINHCLRYRREDGGIIETRDGFGVSVSSSKKSELMMRINFN